MKVIIKMKGHQYRWLAGVYYDLENSTFLKVASMVATWWIVAFFVELDYASAFTLS